MEMDKKLFQIMQKFIDSERLALLWGAGDELPLTGEEWNMSAIDMVYLFFEVEENFQISIDADNICNYEFNTVAGIKRMISGFDSVK